MPTPICIIRRDVSATEGNRRAVWTLMEKQLLVRFSSRLFGFGGDRDQQICDHRAVITCKR